jgi:hypothetical protein
LGKKLDALLALLIAMGKEHLRWTSDWVSGCLSQFDLNEEYVAGMSGATKEEVKKEKVKAKTRKEPQKPSFLDRFKED